MLYVHFFTQTWSLSALYSVIKNKASFTISKKTGGAVNRKVLKQAMKLCGQADYSKEISQTFGC